MHTMDPRWKHPFTCVVAGPTSSGKTHFVSRFIQHGAEMVDSPPQKVLWFYGEWQDAYVNLRGLGIHFIEGLPDEKVIDPKLRNLVVVDDLLSETDGRVTRLFTKGSHHRNTSVMFISQNLFDKNKENRTITLNAHYIVLFKSPRDALQVEQLGRQMYPGQTKFMREAFADATAEPYSYLLVDLKPSTPENMRLRANIFPGELQVVYTKR